jgi:hypothetical protein
MSGYYLCDTCGNKRVEKPPYWSCVCLPYLIHKLTIHDNQTPHEVCRHWEPKEDTDAD